MKKTGLLLLLLLMPLLLLSFGRDAAAAGNAKIIMDNKELIMPAGVTVENAKGNILVPIRVVTTNLGYDVQWEKKTQKVTLQKNGKVVELAVGSKIAYSDGISMDLTAAPKQTKNTVLVPLKFVGQQFGLQVGWDNVDKIVYLTGNSSNGNEGVDNGEPNNGTVGTDPVNPAAPGGSDNVTSPVATSQVMGAVFNENRLMIASAAGAKPVVTLMNNPYRIVVDFPNTIFSTDFAGGIVAGKLDTTGYPQVSEVRYSLFSQSPATVRFVIQMTGNYPYQVIADEASGLVTIDLNMPGSGPVTGGGYTGTGQPVVVLDAGHGGTQPGATSLTKRLEKDFNLAVILKAAALLQQESGITVVLTRNDDRTLGLQERVDIAEAMQADLFISLHANAMPTTYPSWNKVTGSETYYTRSESLLLAQIMHKHLVAGTGFKDNGVRSKSLHVTRETSMPAVLLEAGYLTNSGDEAALYSEGLQDALAREIVSGIKEYLGM
ncbi:N-acetylmuramoyl-L-alanine amidase [Paenibacillus sp. sgz500958]|uniref:N-acetylmuramoyl-L-alanine amidase n=1 Tax=Paenibacillus sp. sgz500958 TaxID=3242475 RepID=UPI0036D2D601